MKNEGIYLLDNLFLKRQCLNGFTFFQPPQDSGIWSKLSGEINRNFFNHWVLKERFSILLGLQCWPTLVWHFLNEPRTVITGGLNHLFRRIIFSIHGHGIWFLKNRIQFLCSEEIIVIGYYLVSFLHNCMENISVVTKYMFYLIMNI